MQSTWGLLGKGLGGLDFDLTIVFLGTHFKVTNEIYAEFEVTVSYSNSDCTKYTKKIGKHGSAEFPDPEECGPRVTVDAKSLGVQPPYHCTITSEIPAPDFVIKPSPILPNECFIISQAP